MEADYVFYENSILITRSQWRETENEEMRFLFLVLVSALAAVFWINWKRFRDI